MLANINGIYRPLDGIIFDADGTLLDSIPFWKFTAKKFMEKYSISNSGIEAMFLTEPVAEIVKAVKQLYSVSSSLACMEKEIMSYVEQAYSYKIQPLPNTVIMLKYFKDNNVKMAAATASEKGHIINAFKRLDIMPYFDTIVTCSELNTTKSEPDIYEYTCKKIGTDKEKTAVMEDSAIGIAAAKRAGFISVGINCISTGDEYTADWYINDASEWYLNERRI
jgi:haloacid dehalogenase superfamily, subfamily IA, variant 3 with third motif having DD or ED